VCNEPFEDLILNPGKKTGSNGEKNLKKNHLQKGAFMLKTNLEN
jgi:hypothetical protein